MFTCDVLLCPLLTRFPLPHGRCIAVCPSTRRSDGNTRRTKVADGGTGRGDDDTRSRRSRSSVIDPRCSSSSSHSSNSYSSSSDRRHLRPFLCCSRH